MQSFWIKWIAVVIFIPLTSTQTGPSKLCEDLLLGQYRCEEEILYSDAIHFEDSCHVIDGASQQYAKFVYCYPAPGIQCNDLTFDGETVGFNYTVPCNKRSDKSFTTALLLSIFLGMFGADRFYLGYPALGLLKLSTFGFMLVGQLVDIILIATQVVKPADGGDYRIDYFGARMQVTPVNVTFPVP